MTNKDDGQLALAGDLPTVPIAQTEGVGGVVATVPPPPLDDAVRLTDDVAAERATAYAVYDTRLLTFVSGPFTDPADGRDYGATKTGRYQLRRV